MINKQFIKLKVKIYNNIQIFKNYYMYKKFNNPKIKSIDETIEKIVNNKVSVSRFGDGEFKWILEIPQDSFQSNSVLLSIRLKEVLDSQNSNHIVCLPDFFGSLQKYEKKAQIYWATFMVRYRIQCLELLSPNRIYYNAAISRLYMDYRDKKQCEKWFHNIKRIWENREVVIVEGEFSRLGVGNNLFHDMKEINRIIVPSVNAFTFYDKILEYIESAISKDKLLLLSIGPTATILAYDLSQKGYQAIDIGHLDIEYEWFLRNSKDKIAIENKYTNEAKNNKDIGDNVDEMYIQQIITKIGC